MTDIMANNRMLDCQLAFLLVEAFEAAVVNALGEELLKSSVGADFRQSQHDVHLLSSTIVHVKHQTEMGGYSFATVFATNCGGTLNNVPRLKADE